MALHHIPVLPEEVNDFLACKEGGIYVDATIGNAGHALHLLQNNPAMGSLVGIDCDTDAVARARHRLEPYAHQARVIHGNFRDLKKILEQNAIQHADGILLDLGVSTFQLKDATRGFSFSLEGPLDMRMDQTAAPTAADLLERTTERELEHLLRTYGQERWARQIARRIKAHLKDAPISTTSDLSRIVLQAIPSRHYPRTIHAATRTFQALRIAVNDELASLEKALDDAVDLLTPQGRICVISFHSLEDAIVKNRFRLWASECICPPGLAACVCRHEKKLRVLTRKPTRPSSREIQANPSARSARLRAAERIQAA